ncbi:PP2C family protein-serine/threonine phosphatase [Terriglobus sp.]|uniref:PP2C family protein-serine/threonine phosphatase n=1 Tax=Terriglobus sp. TaxID=1889013 RepID=UPI003B008A9C
MDIRIRAAALSDVGLQRRLNEDSFGFDLDRGLFVICDGVGGRAAGEVASRSAVDCVLSRFPYGADGVGGGSELQRAIQAANRSIFQASNREPLYAGMATTIVAAHFDGSRMWIAHVGDSRAYLLRGGSLHRLTDDDSQLSQMLREGHRDLSASDMARMDSVLTQAIGASDMVVPTVTVLQVELGDCFLLATDGICKALSNAEMLSLLLAATSPEQACHHLTTAANGAGGHDNATCIIVEID